MSRASRNRRRHWIALAVATVVFVLADAFLVSTLDASQDDLLESAAMSISLGLCIGQINLISIWAALAPGRIVVRLPWALLLTVIMWAAVCIGLKFDHAASPVYYRAGVILGAAQLAAQTPLWIGAQVWKWRLASRPQRKFGVENSDVQFSLQHMMVGTFFLAFALGLFRFVISGQPVDWSQLKMDGELLVILAGAVITNLLIVVPCIWLAFLPLARLRRTMVSWTAWVILVSIVEDVIFSVLLGPPSDLVMVFLVTATINLVQCWVVVSVLLRLRRLGFRLVRLEGRRPSAIPT